MPSIHHISERHVDIDRRPGHYLCFPDVCLAGNGNLVAVYNEFEQHVGTRRRLVKKTSPDQGRTWSGPEYLCAWDGHCPRISRLSDDQLLILDDSGVYVSIDHGAHFAFQPRKEFPHGIPDRPLELDFETLLSAGHMYRGTHPLPVSGQPLVEQMGYLSENRGATWKALSVIGHDENLPLCEISMARLADGTILGLMRENSYVYEPMYASLSTDRGKTWSAPVPTPFLGHRPCLGVLDGDRLLVTYRDVGPNPGTAAWTGTVRELLETDFQVHGLHPEPERLRATGDGLLVDCGRDSLPVRWALRPMTDPRRARAELSARVKVSRAGGSGFGLRLGCWFKLYPDRIEAWPASDDPPKRAPEHLRTPVSRGRFHSVKLVYERGVTTLFVDGRKKLCVDVDPEARDSRPVLFGSVSPDKPHGSRYLLRSLGLRTEEPGYGREYSWSWRHGSGLPDGYASRRILELRNNRKASLGDFGYSGWIPLPDGRIFCAYHHCEPEAEDYEPGRTCHVAGTWFEDSDFG